MEELIFFIISKNFNLKIKKELPDDVFNHIYLIKLKNQYLYGFFLKDKELINIYKNYNLPVIELKKINIIDQIKLPFLEEIQNNISNIFNKTNFNYIKILESLVKKIIKFKLILNIKIDSKNYNILNIEALKKKYNYEIYKSNINNNTINLKIEIKSTNKKDIKKEIKKILKILKISKKYLKNYTIDYDFKSNENYKELYSIFFILKTNKKTLKYKYEHKIFPIYNFFKFINNFENVLSNIDKNFINKNTNNINNKKIIVFIFVKNIEKLLKEKIYFLLESKNIIFFITSFLGFLIYNYFDYILIFDSYIFEKENLINKTLNPIKNINKIYLDYHQAKNNKKYIELIYEKLNNIIKKLHSHNDLIEHIKKINTDNFNNSSNFKETNWWYFTQHTKFYYIYCNNCLNKPYCENCSNIIKNNNNNEKINLKINKSNFNKLYTKLKHRKINFLELINNLILECRNCKLKYNIFNCQYCGEFNWKIKIFDPQKYTDYIEHKLNINLTKIDYKKLFSFYYDLNLKILYNNTNNIVIFDYYFLEFPFVIKELNIIINLLELERIFNPVYFYFIENKELSLIEYLLNLTKDFNNFSNHLIKLFDLEEKIRKINKE